MKDALGGPLCPRLASVYDARQSRTWMDEIAGFQATGRRTLGPGADLLELDDARGYRHTALVFHPEFRDHPAIGAGLDVIEGFLEAPYVTGLLELVASDREQGAFVYQTGQAWSLAELVRALADTGESGGVRAGLELMYAAGQILVEASDAGAHHGVYAHGGLNPWRVMLKADGQVEILGYALPQVEVMHLLQDSGEIPTEDSFRYCPPERLEGREEGLDSDLFALALVSFELMTGKPVYDGLVNEIRRQASRAEGSRRLFAFKNQLSQRVRDLLGRCLKSNSQDRFEDGEEYLRAVRTTLPGASGPSLMELMESVGRRSQRPTSALNDGKTQQISHDDLASMRQEGEHAERQAWSPPVQGRRPGQPQRGGGADSSVRSLDRRAGQSESRQPAPPPAPPPLPEALRTSQARRPRRARESTSIPESMPQAAPTLEQPAPAAPPRSPRSSSSVNENTGRMSPISPVQRAARWSVPDGDRRQRRASTSGEQLPSPTRTQGFSVELPEADSSASRVPAPRVADSRSDETRRPGRAKPARSKPVSPVVDPAIQEPPHQVTPPAAVSRSASDVIEAILSGSTSGDRAVRAADPPASLEEAFGVPRSSFGFGSGLEGPPTGSISVEEDPEVERTLNQNKPGVGPLAHEPTQALRRPASSPDPEPAAPSIEPESVSAAEPKVRQATSRTLSMDLQGPTQVPVRTPDLIPPSQGGKGRAILLKRGPGAKPVKTRIPGGFSLSEAVSFLVGNVVPVRTDLQGRLLCGYRLGPETGPVSGDTSVSDFPQGTVLVLHPVPSEEIWVHIEVRSAADIPDAFRVPVNLALSTSSMCDALASWLELPPGRWSLRHQGRVLSPHLLLAELGLKEEPSLVLAR